ncbi:MAG TPA: BadF/BadG/BcrA/BcrD ATPase family protein [Actinomycetes bacterium]|nr:BadF/BadG/BcrA/BcrD ATPase family protein [Actinomycetes bacterium]
MTELLVAVDGGNSKTDVVLVDADGVVLAEVRGDGTRSHVVGVPAMVDGVAALVRAARREAGLDDTIAISAGAFCLANLDVAEAEAQALEDLRRQGLCDRLVVRNDTLAPLRAGSPHAWGIAVVSGAGINAVGVHPDGREARFLALGDVTGDWGGGHSVGLAGLGAAVRAGDGRGPATSLRTAVSEHYGMPSPEAVALALADDRVPMETVHGLAPAVFAAAEDGDAVATSIVLRLADEVATLALALARRLDLVEAAVPVVLAGSTLQLGPAVLLDAVRQRILGYLPAALPRVLDVRPVAGAALLALDLVGHDARAEERIRSALALRAAGVS